MWVSIHVIIMDWVKKLMDWIGLDLENWTHVQLSVHLVLALLTSLAVTGVRTQNISLITFHEVHTTFTKRAKHFQCIEVCHIQFGLTSRLCSSAYT